MEKKLNLKVHVRVQSIRFWGMCDHVSNWALQTQLGRPYTRGCSAPVPMFTQDLDKLVIGTPKKQHGIHTLLYKYTISYRIFEGFHKWGYSKRMLVMENPSIHGWFGGTPWPHDFGNPHFLVSDVFRVSWVVEVIDGHTGIPMVINSIR